MFTRQFELFKLYGFSIKIDLSWFLVAALITWSLAAALFPQMYPGLATSTYWIMGVIGAVGLFVSIILHELAHSLVARRYDLPMRGITLFLFGGVAEMSEEPPSAKAEFLMSIAGPIASVVIGGVFYGIYYLAGGWGWPPAVTGVLWYLGLINLIVVAFNLIPAFPLDGGRVLRSALWHFKGDVRWATRVSSAIGSGFGIFLIVWGVIMFVTGNIIGGIWWVLIGLFLRAAAGMSYRRLMVRRALEGEPVSRFMSTDVVTVSPDITVRELVENYIYKHHYKMLPVARNGQLEGCITTRAVKSIPREEWDRRTVRELLESCTDQNTIAPDADAMQAFSRMERNDSSRLMVVEGSHLRGIISLKDLRRFLSLKVELEDE